MSTDEKTVERCNWRDFLKASEETPAKIIAALDEHFKHYAAPGSKCPGCDATVFANSLTDAFLHATFEWGIVHGEGWCRECGWPATVYHFIHDADGKEIAALRNVGLVVHPDFVERRTEARGVGR